MQLCGVGASGQNVTIVANPDVGFYIVGDMLTLTCMVDPPTSNVEYLWECPPPCFADGMLTQNITRNLTAMDNYMIDCLVNFNDTVNISGTFNLLVAQGT